MHAHSPGGGLGFNTTATKAGPRLPACLLTAATASCPRTTGSASDHMVCCVDIKSVDQEYNEDDPHVAYHNPLSGPIRRNSHPSSYSW